MVVKKLFERVLPHPKLQDLAGWRGYYIGVMLFLALMIFPIGFAFSIPTFLAQGKRELLALDIGAIILIGTALHFRYSAVSVKVFFVLLYGLMLTFIIILGPLYARPGWLVMCTVSAAFLFGVRAAAITTAINAALLTLLYWLVGPHLAAWAPVYRDPLATWVMFTVNISLISLFASMPVGLLLNQMNRLLIQEHGLSTRLALESRNLQSANRELQNEISERRKAEDEKRRLQTDLDQAQKMEAVGELAGGIAHDFNNILSVITGYSQLALDDKAVSEKTKQKITQVIYAGERARELVNQILVFSRKTEVLRAPLKLGESVSDALKMMQSLIPANIKVTQTCDASGMILSSSLYVHQIIMNLCSNAIHAMGKDGGVLDVRLTREYPGEPATPDELPLQEGPYLKITVSDTGHGMTSEIAARIFEPYFTTKEPGRGTGMGLKVVYGIVKSHGGFISCRSTPGAGSCFDVYFPEIEDRRNPERSREEEAIPTGTETILYIDDEPTLCEIAGEMLERLGYQVVGKTSSVEAYDLFIADPQRFHTIITDLNMPHLSGEILAQKILALRPDTPIIMCTGYCEQTSRDDAFKLGVREFLIKPYTMNQLAHAVRRTIDGKRSSQTGPCAS